MLNFLSKLFSPKAQPSTEAPPTVETKVKPLSLKKGQKIKATNPWTRKEEIMTVMGRPNITSYRGNRRVSVHVEILGAKTQIIFNEGQKALLQT